MFKWTPTICCTICHPAYLQSNMPSCCVLAEQDVNLNFHLKWAAQNSVYYLCFLLAFEWFFFLLFQHFFAAVDLKRPSCLCRAPAGECSGDAQKKRGGTRGRAPAGLRVICIQQRPALGLMSSYAGRIMESGHCIQTRQSQFLKANEVHLKEIISHIILLSG